MSERVVGETRWEKTEFLELGFKNEIRRNGRGRNVRLGRRCIDKVERF